MDGSRSKVAAGFLYPLSMSKNDNKSLSAAKVAKNDEFYTQLSDIEKELKHYKDHFRGKVILCNCDDPYESNFFKYFCLNFKQLGIKKLIATCYGTSPVAGQQLSLFDVPYLGTQEKKKAYKAVITDIPDSNNDGAIDMFDVESLLKYSNNVITLLEGNGDFRSKECVALLQEADIAVTNVPFSLFREYIALMEKYSKKYLIVGNKNAVTYKEVFPLLKNNKIWIGCRPMNADFWLMVPEDNPYEKIINGIHYKHIMACWFTNLDHEK